MLLSSPALPSLVLSSDFFQGPVQLFCLDSGIAFNAPVKPSVDIILDPHANKHNDRATAIMKALACFSWDLMVDGRLAPLSLIGYMKQSVTDLIFSYSTRHDVNRIVHLGSKLQFLFVLFYSLRGRIVQVIRRMLYASKQLCEVWMYLHLSYRRVMVVVCLIRRKGHPVAL